MLESKFQQRLIEDIEAAFPGAMVLKNDPNYIQGIPDLTVLFMDRWAFLEVKRSEKEYLSERGKRPNQEYYINYALNVGAYGSFVYPENKEVVLHELQSAFTVGR